MMWNSPYGYLYRREKKYPYDLKLYDSMMGWLNCHRQNYSVGNNHYGLTLSRGAILKQTEDILSCTGTKPNNVCVVLHSSQ